MRHCTLIIAASAATVALAGNAQASPIQDEPFSETVAHDDLDLTTREGVARLDQRIEARIRRACDTGGRDAASLSFERECRAGARASAKAQVRFAIAQANADKVRLAASDGSDAEDLGA